MQRPLNPCQTCGHSLPGCHRNCNRFTVYNYQYRLWAKETEEKRRTYFNEYEAMRDVKRVIIKLHNRHKRNEQRRRRG